MAASRPSRLRPQYSNLVLVRRHQKVYALALLALLVLTHPLWLALLGGLLVADDPPGNAQQVLILDGDKRYELAASMVSSGVARGGDVLVYEARDAWLVQHGVVLAPEALARRELGRRGISAERLRVLRGAADDWRAALRALASYLDQAPEARVAVLTARIGSQTVSLLADHLLGPARSRVTIVPLRDRRFDETDFWRSRMGLKSCLNATIDLVYAWLRPHAPSAPPSRPEQHVRALLRGHTDLGPLSWPATWLDVGSTPQAVDYAFVMPGDLHYRTATAAAMAQAGLAGAIVVPTTEAAGDVLDGLSEDDATLIRKVLVLLGAPRERIVVLQRGSTSTHDDLYALRDFMRAHARARVAIVTDRLHTRRTRFTGDQLLGETAQRVVYVSAPSPTLHGEPWWATSSGFTMVTSEYLKLTFYWFRYGSGPFWVMSIAAAAITAVVVRRRRQTRRSAERSGGGALGARLG